MKGGGFRNTTTHLLRVLHDGLTRQRRRSMPTSSLRVGMRTRAASPYLLVKNCSAAGSSSARRVSGKRHKRLIAFLRDPCKAHADRFQPHQISLKHARAHTHARSLRVCLSLVLTGRGRCFPLSPVLIFLSVSGRSGKKGKPRIFLV